MVYLAFDCVGLFFGAVVHDLNCLVCPPDVCLLVVVAAHQVLLLHVHGLVAVAYLEADLERRLELGSLWLALVDGVSYHYLVLQAVHVLVLDSHCHFLYRIS